MATMSRSAFFYGTLMAPQVLHRVCHGSSNPSNPLYATHKLQTVPAILHGYRRHRVKHADYPAIQPKPDATVRGTYVTGLTDADIWRLDIFEGSEYERKHVKVNVLTKAGDVESEQVEGEQVVAETYVWCGGVRGLEDAEWDFKEFQREKMRFWVGSEGAAEYADVDDAVAAQGEDGTGGRGNGHIASALSAEHQKDEVLKGVV